MSVTLVSVPTAADNTIPKSEHRTIVIGVEVFPFSVVLRLNQVRRLFYT